MYVVFLQCNLALLYPNISWKYAMWDLCHNAHFIIPPNWEVSVLPYSFCIGTMLVKPCNDKLSWKALSEINKELLQLFCREKKEYIWMNGLNFSESIPIYVFKAIWSWIVSAVDCNKTLLLFTAADWKK